MGGTKRVVMDAEAIDRSVTRIAYEMLEDNKGASDLILVAIRSGGILLSGRIQKAIIRIEGIEIPTGILDITLYRDDVVMTGKMPKMGETDIPCSLNGKKVVLVDDVIFTGRTIRAAMDALMDFGRPQLVRLAVLIDRGHRELPIRPDYVGERLPSALWEDVSVNLSESGLSDEVVIL
ncbi:MAG: bifunctional pyr operon transcriptional regulator/uracil phosphoribosyltransferase PyrR [Syntrophales bacterium]|jgi:pyrimidine operon attenuation protein/uracil phosphoribosyltransferase|nr:bifunctional pyr operon transcriptional regulator/uracil phosphoribosyltransferase PyrR [Syntrophales bacterium]MCK9527137.1 bifunctional pyr operon transcriptional regulator/uracil phosphoribosyltransferase PyrR [Syntrophales bacterium]MDX9921738.1 bifunctional pyr operon transcriptional regulator/uracil phosphoribosyltransferase PyrR [Syntrophales bacterium]